MFGQSWRVARIAGIDIRIDSSWTIIFLLVGYTLFIRFATVGEFDVGTGAAVALAGLTTVLFFASVLLHELAHAVTSKARGVPVRGITLFLFGGATHAKLETRRPRDEFVITVVGPGTSLVLAAVFWLLSVTTRG
ncbi:MAG TPA: site-2 protease family protein, partial [Actinomycetota bacterium]|nr:site-2 protease family protein [Actinomycetota bacterium]